MDTDPLDHHTSFKIINNSNLPEGFLFRMGAGMVPQMGGPEETLTTHPTLKPPLSVHRHPMVLQQVLRVKGLPAFPTLGGRW